jgi:hypothetical protein
MQVVEKFSKAKCVLINKHCRDESRMRKFFYITRQQKKTRTWYHENRFVNHRFITNRGRVDASGAGSFSRLANAALTESLASTHRPRSFSRVITSGSKSSERPWLSTTMTQDDSFSSRVSNPELVFCSRIRALLYAALNFREPAHVVNDNRRMVSIGMTTDLEY